MQAGVGRPWATLQKALEAGSPCMQIVYRERVAGVWKGELASTGLGQRMYSVQQGHEIGAGRNQQRCAWEWAHDCLTWEQLGGRGERGKGWHLEYEETPALNWAMGRCALGGMVTELLLQELAALRSGLGS